MENMDKYIKVIKDYILNNYLNNFREAAEPRLPHPFIVPGANYTSQLWDWDSWLTGYALMDIEDPKIEEYQKGCVLNFLSAIDEKGRIPILIEDKPSWLFDLKEDYEGNIHKPCLAIHTLEICKRYKNTKWIEKDFDKFVKYLDFYEKNQKHEETGLYFWINDLAIGFDNDPTVFYHQDKTVGAIYLNSLMYMELYSASELARLLGKEYIASHYEKKANDLKEAIRRECFDNVDGYFYSVDLSLKPIDPNHWLHSGHPRIWKSLPIKVTTWAGMLPLWAGIASKEEADRCVKHYLKENGLCAPYGIRSIAKYEKMYGIFDTGNPSCWIGPVWINANYFTYLGFKNYGYDELAKDIAYKTIKLLGEDLIKNNDLHEYYEPDTGEGVRGAGFQSWNFLVLKMINDLEK